MGHLADCQSARTGFGWSSCESKDKGGKTWYAVVKEKIPELKARPAAVR